MLQESLKKLVNHDDLSADEAHSACSAIFKEGENKDYIASFLLHLSQKEMRPEELGGCMKAYHEKMTKIKPLRGGILHMSLFENEHNTNAHVLLGSAFVIAGVGIPVCFAVKKHRRLDGTLLETLEKMGISTKLDPSQIERCLSDIGISFYDPQKFFEKSEELEETLYNLRGETVIDIAEMLVSPTPANFHLVGAHNPDKIELYAGGYHHAGSKRSMVARGEDGIRALTTTTTTRISENNKGVGTYFLSNQDVRIKQATKDELRVQSVAENAEKIEKTLENSKGAVRDAILFNAAAGLMVVGIAKDWQDALKKSEKSLKMGRALSKLKNVRNWTQNASNA